jgi:hypothetical protein
MPKDPSVPPPKYSGHPVLQKVEKMHIFKRISKKEG